MDPSWCALKEPGCVAWQPTLFGRNAEGVCLRGRSIARVIAWVLWLSVHLFKLIGFRNRLFVLIDWAWDYFFYEGAVRLILPCENMLAAARCDT